jgi:hypothetical protein
MIAGSLVARWNWKAAVLSAAIRGTIFFTTNLGLGLDAARRAVVVDLLFRVPLAGWYAAVIQAAVDATHAWQTWAVVLLVPIAAHAIEFGVHHSAGTPALHVSLAVSAAFSVVSSTFEWFAMRRGALTVGAGAASLGTDVRRLPRLISAFLAAPPLALWRALRGRGPEGTA